jgi:hypothetical protein
MVLQFGVIPAASTGGAQGNTGPAMAVDPGKMAHFSRGDGLPEGRVAGDILKSETVSISPAVESHLFDSPGALLADLEARGYLWTWGYVTEDRRHGMVTWRIVLRAGLAAPRARVLLDATMPNLPKGAVCTAGVPGARLHPNTALSITAFSSTAVAACRRWLAADFLPRALPRLLGSSPCLAVPQARRAEDPLASQPATT